MTARVLRRFRGNASEGGAVLVLAVLFVLIVGLVGGAIASLATTNLAVTSVLGGDQSQSYAAQAAVEVGIETVRRDKTVATAPGYGSNPCPIDTPVTVPGAQTLHVVCAIDQTPALQKPFERTIVFAACSAASNCLTTPVTGHPMPIAPNAVVVATTLFSDLASGCSGTTTDTCADPATCTGADPTFPCFVPGKVVDVTSYEILKSAG